MRKPSDPSDTSDTNCRGSGRVHVLLGAMSHTHVQNTGFSNLMAKGLSCKTTRCLSINLTAVVCSILMSNTTSTIPGPGHRPFWVGS